ncbi:MAG: CAP domain-containing protein [Chloroflexi bacterium]|nr:CAP domain-containing protein [Chloroflexota bacterium]
MSATSLQYRRGALGLLFGLLAGLGLSTTLSGTAAAATDLTRAGAEAEVVRLLNQQRAAAGKVALRVDGRLTTIARYRSTDMATKHYFSHEQPDGRYAWDMLTPAGILWYSASENIAWNEKPTLRESAAGTGTQWRNSPPHYATTIDADLNYIGVGVTTDDAGRRLWTAVYMKGPDRTGGWGRMETPLVASSTMSTTTVTLTWHGGDIRLSILTAGLRDFTVQRRVDGAAWQAFRTATTANSWKGSLARGHRYDFRVRSRDRAGNLSAWSRVITVRP